MYTAQSELDALTQAALTISVNKGETLIHRMYYLKSFRNSSLSAAQLNIIQNDFYQLRQAGLKCILRFAYSEGNGEPDAPMNIILGHLNQLKSLLQANADVIYVMQAGFIGAWGEWHTSSNGLDNTTDETTLVNKILSVLPSDRMIQVRTPASKQNIFSRTSALTNAEAFNKTSIARVGHYNDGFLASSDDLGTFTDTTVGKQYISDECLFVPLGGETAGLSTFSIGSNAVYQMERLHFSFLNSGYESNVLDSWISGGYMTDIKRRLGYRFQFLDAVISNSVKLGNALRFHLRLQNIGFAPLYNPYSLVLIIEKTDTKAKHYVQLPYDPRTWLPNQVITLDTLIRIPNGVSLGDYKLYLNSSDASDSIKNRVEYSIRFANANVWNATLGYNDLLSNVNINNTSGGETGNTSLSFDSANISIDGNFTDWSVIPAFYADANNDNGGGEVDLTAGYFTNSTDTLFLKTDVTGSINPTGTNAYTIYIDTDQSITTGFTSTWWSIGADYKLYQDLNGSVLYKFMGANNSDDTWGWIGIPWNYKSITANYSNHASEMKVALADLGVTSSNSIWLQWRAEPGTDAMPVFNDVRTDAPLPVELTSFTAVVNKNSVELKWHTATEVNNYGFEVERIRNYELGIRNWEKIGFVNGNGNSNSSKDYSFVDKTNSKGKYAYRLKQIDNDGKYKYSKEVEVDLGTPKEFLLAQNYPNPFNPSTVIKFVVSENGKAVLKVYNTLGSEVTTLFNGNALANQVYEVNFNAANLPSGVYFYKLQLGNKLSIKKMLLLK